MKLRSIVPLCLMAAAAGGCDAPPSAPSKAESPAQAPAQAPVTAPVAAGEAIEYHFRPDSPLRKAYNDQRFILPVMKGDQFDNYRLAHPERYAITAPPANIETVRPMVEWEPMQAIMMSYPGNMTSASNASKTFHKIARFSSLVADVWFVVDGDKAKDALIKGMLAEGMTQADVDTKVKFLTAELDSIWYIDSGPLPIIDTATNTYAFSDFRYYHPRPIDDGVPTVVGRELQNTFGLSSPTVTYRMPLNVEGGTFQATTDGVCFTSSRQLYYMSCDAGACKSSYNNGPLADVNDPAKTPELAYMKQVWGQYAGCKDIIVTHSITDDGTGHIDMYMKVVDDNTIIMGAYEAPFEAGTPQEANAARMDANAALLEAYTKADGSKFTVHRLVMPGHRSSSEGKVPFTYINSTFINGLNLWPVSPHAAWQDRQASAAAKWSEVMPDYEHIPIDSTELSFWSGAIHCITRTIPKVEPSLWVADGACESDVCAAPEGGYDGACQVGDSGIDLCWGPVWECGCNDCTNNCEPPEDKCNGLTYEGCCDGSVLKYCEDNEIVEGNCPNGCGWAGQFYDCGGNGADPSGNFPISCEPEVCTPDCTGNVCGDDGCGGSCGVCEDGLECKNGQCATPCAHECAAGETGCEDGKFFTCNAGAGDCRVKSYQDCAAIGKVCGESSCVDAPSEDLGNEPDAGPTGDASGGEDTKGGDVGGPPVGGGGSGGGSSGCQGGSDASGLAWLAAAAALIALIRRRRLA